MITYFADTFYFLALLNADDIVTDECADSPRLDRLLDCLAARLAAIAAAGYVAPDTFLGVAGRKLFRDEIWSNLRMVFQADHRYYRSHGLYDFPRRSLKTRVAQGSMTLLTRIPSFRREFRRRLKDAMVRPFQKVLEDLSDVSPGSIAVENANDARDVACNEPEAQVNGIK